MEMDAVVLLSGGIDSATCLALAKNQRERWPHALSFRYGQRHAIEIEAAQRIAKFYGVPHKIVDLDLRQFGGSALTADIDVPTAPTDGVPVTYVPARNTVFLSIAMAYAETLRAPEIWIGANAVDYSGYPDCRPEYIDAFNRMAALATVRPVRVIAPLVQMTKAEIIKRGHAYYVPWAQTSSCYDPTEAGACGACDSCRIRRAGFESAGIADPTVYR